MKLKENQLRLLQHLAQYLTLDYLSCLHILDAGEGRDRAGLSYAFRPLTKHGYAVKHKDGTVNILAKGRALFPKVDPLVTLGGGSAAMRRVGSISRMAALLQENGFPSTGAPNDSDTTCFVPSTRWREIRPGILSTTRFLGILLLGEHRLAVYDIGDGRMEWQLRAERSLFYNKYGEYDTSATGMLWICEESKRIEVAQAVIRQTMWQRRQLLGKATCNPRERPVRYSRAPIRIAPQYEHVYLTTPRLLNRDTDAIEIEEEIIEKYQGNSLKCSGPASGDYHEAPESAGGAPCRYYINTAADLLKYVYFFSAAKDHRRLMENDDIPYVPPMRYAMVLPRRDLEIAKMYPDVSEMEETVLYEYIDPQNA